MERLGEKRFCLCVFCLFIKMTRCVLKDDRLKLLHIWDKMDKDSKPSYLPYLPSFPNRYFQNRPTHGAVAEEAWQTTRGAHEVSKLPPSPSTAGNIPFDPSATKWMSSRNRVIRLEYLQCCMRQSGQTYHWLLGNHVLCIEKSDLIIQQ